jgi:DNA-binding CsgD family transcriptional regulator
MDLEFPDPHLARTINEAAFDPAKWIDVCDGMAHLIGGCGSLIFPSDSVQQRIGVPHSAYLQPSFDRYVKEEWYKRDVRFDGVPKIGRRGYITDADNIDYGDVKKSSFYQDFLRPEKIGWYAAIGLKTQQNLWFLSIQQRPGQEPFSTQVIQKALSFCALLNNSAAVARHLGFARVHGAANVLEQHGLCAIALDANERVVHVSPSAELHLTDRLQISGGKLRAMRAADAPALARLIAGICRNSQSLLNSQVALPRTNGKPPLVLYGCHLPDAQCDVFQPAVALLVISDPQRPQHISQSLLADYFGLTPAEADLAVALARGTSAQQHAIDNHISPATARNHLQAVLRKTGTHRQGELVAALNKVIPRRDFDF